MIIISNLILQRYDCLRTQARKTIIKGEKQANH